MPAYKVSLNLQFRNFDQKLSRTETVSAKQQEWQSLFFLSFCFCFPRNFQIFFTSNIGHYRPLFLLISLRLCKWTLKLICRWLGLCPDPMVLITSRVTPWPSALKPKNRWSFIYQHQLIYEETVCSNVLNLKWISKCKKCCNCCNKRFYERFAKYISSRHSDSNPWYWHVGLKLFHNTHIKWFILYPRNAVDCGFTFAKFTYTFWTLCHS